LKYDREKKKRKKNLTFCLLPFLLLLCKISVELLLLSDRFERAYGKKKTRRRRRRRERR
jgi:hypothetical protein